MMIYYYQPLLSLRILFDAAQIKRVNVCHSLSCFSSAFLSILHLCPPAMIPISQDKRVSMGLNGDLYFSNVLAKDAHTDYSCNARFLFTHTIQQKNPFTLKVLTSKQKIYTQYAYIYPQTFKLILSFIQLEPLYTLLSSLHVCCVCFDCTPN